MANPLINSGDAVLVVYLRCQGMAEGNRLPSLESPDSSQKFVLFELFVFRIIPAYKS